MEALSGKTSRLFFALWPEESVRAALVKTTREHLHEQGKNVPPENLHITLAFIGSVNGETRDCMEQAVQNISCTPFALTIEHIWHWTKPRILCAGCADFPETLSNLVTGLNQALLPCGYEPEKRPFVPHVTLARKVNAYSGDQDIKPVEWHANRFCLVESETRPEGVQYNVIKEWSLISD